MVLVRRPDKQGRPKAATPSRRRETCEASAHRTPLPDAWFADDAHGTRAIFASAAMVGQSDQPFRQLLLRHGATLVYSEMLLAETFASDATYRADAIGAHLADADQPLVVQLATRDPVAFLAAALAAQDLGASAVELNLSCQQFEAYKCGYGAWMTNQKEWALCASVVGTAASHAELRIPVGEKEKKKRRKREESARAHDSRCVAHGDTLSAIPLGQRSSSSHAPYSPMKLTH